jgi:predicted dehydrogenase
MPPKQERRLRVGVLGCGPIAQAAHFESCTKARNADLFAICDVADDLRERMAATHRPQRSYGDYATMLADPDVDAVIVATSDAFHVPASIQALQAGKHVLSEKPLGVTVEEVVALKDAVAKSGKIFQVGHMKRFDEGLQFAKAFVDDEMGEMLALKAWYCDSTHRYAMTDATQPLMVTSAARRKPAQDPKADMRRYLMLAHGCHLVDTARYLAGDIVSVQARLSERFGARCWFVDTEFANGTLGHLDLTVAVRMDWHEGFQLYGRHGSVIAKTYNPWYYKSSDVEVFFEKDATTRRPLGADGHFYRRQVEAFADVILRDAPMTGANIDDGIASVRAMVAIARSAESGKPMRLADAEGGL